MRMSQVIFSSFFLFFLTLVVTQWELTVFKSKWQCFPPTAPGSSREPRSLIDSDVFFESVLKFFIHEADRSLGAWQGTLISTEGEKKEKKERKARNNSEENNSSGIKK